MTFFKFPHCCQLAHVACKDRDWIKCIDEKCNQTVAHIARARVKNGEWKERRTRWKGRKAGKEGGEEGGDIPKIPILTQG